MQAFPVEGTMPNFNTLIKNSKRQVSAKLRTQTSSVAVLTPCRLSEREPRSMTALELFSEIVPRCFATPSCSPLWNAGLYHRTAGKESIKSRTCLSHVQEKVNRTSIRHSLRQPFVLPYSHQILAPQSHDLLERRTSSLLVSSAHITSFGSAGGDAGNLGEGKGDKARRPDQNLRSGFAFHYFHSAGADISAVREMVARSSSEGSADIQTTQPGAVTSDSSSADMQTREGGAEDIKPRVDQGTLRWTAGAAAIPHPSKVDKGGEDAHFISAELCAVGVADGVGGWAYVQVDAGIYARQLMQNSLRALEHEPQGCVDTRKCLKVAHQQTNVRGSATACLVVLADNKLHSANLGDSGFMVIRNGRTIFKSPPQQQSFNFPYQLGSEGGNSPDQADVFSLPVAAGDVVVLGTDGVFDNLYDAEVTSAIVHCTRAGWGPQSAAEKIATLARIRAEDSMRMSPFARAAQDAGMRFSGGKLDDITVVVTYISESSQLQSKL